MVLGYAIYYSFQVTTFLATIPLSLFNTASFKLISKGKLATKWMPHSCVSFLECTMVKTRGLKAHDDILFIH